MYRTTDLRLPARRTAAVIGAAVALATAGTVAVAPAVQAAPAVPYGGASATATVLRADLGVSLLNTTAQVPVKVSLNAVQAPADAKETALAVTVGHGVEDGRRISLLRARAATANATADDRRAQGYANVVHAKVHVPGLPLLSLVELDALTSRATCQAGQRPTASSTLAGVTVLGRHVELAAAGPTDLTVPGVGRVTLNLSDTVTTSSTAAATALRLQVHIDPLTLGVAAVTGEVTLAQATCRTPHAGGSTAGTAAGGASDGGTASGGTGTAGTSGGSASSGGASAGSASGGSGTASGGDGTRTQTLPDGGTTPDGNLAETGSGSATPYLAVGAAALIAAGAGTYLFTGRRRKAAAGTTGAGTGRDL